MVQEDVQAILRFSGRVQGVGFRYTARQIAASYAVTGTARNVSDGSVECIVEGTRKEINAFLADILTEMARYIRDHSTQWAPATGQFTGFGIII
jgi:acylphosphatase